MNTSILKNTPLFRPVAPYAVGPGAGTSSAEEERLRTREVLRRSPPSQARAQQADLRLLLPDTQQEDPVRSVIQVDRRALLGILRRDTVGAIPLEGITCNGYIGMLLQEELFSAMERWGPFELLIDPRLLCHQTELHLADGNTWKKRCEEQRRWETQARSSEGMRS